MTLNPPQDYLNTDKTHRTGLIAARPAAADVVPGTLYFATDTGTITRSNGAAWTAFGGGGAPGPTGPIGPMGPIGYGIDGIDGEDGFLYPPGKDGTVGTPGSIGPAGITGPQGIDGLSGEQGEDGIQGPIGPTGNQGLRGFIGPNGYNGLDGNDGLDGVDGFPGPIGPVGNQGIQGNPGISNVPGPMGFSGIDGEDGIDGFSFPGPVGSRGLTGAAGTQVLLAPYITEAEEVVEPAPLFPSLIIPVPILNSFNSNSVASVATFAVDTYLIGSEIKMPANYPKLGTRYRLVITVVKTGAGLAAPVFTIRYGTAGAIGDTARHTITFGAQTAVIDTGTFELFLNFRVGGAAAILAGFGRVLHNLAVTGLSVTGAAGNGIVVPGPSAAFDSTPQNSFIGCSLNAGLNAVWTVSVVQAELEG